MLKLLGFIGTIVCSVAVMIFIGNGLDLLEETRFGDHLFYQFVFLSQGVVIPVTLIYRKKTLKNFVYNFFASKLAQPIFTVDV